jgi:hypothetical protein
MSEMRECVNSTAATTTSAASVAMMMMMLMGRRRKRERENEKANVDSTLEAKREWKRMKDGEEDDKKVIRLNKL